MHYESYCDREDPEKQFLCMIPGIESRYMMETFYFQKRSGKLNWRRLVDVDLQRIVTEVNVDILQEHIENLVFSGCFIFYFLWCDILELTEVQADLTEEDFHYFTNAQFMKLFRLVQLELEYLLHVQNYLASNLHTRDEQLAVAESQVRQLTAGAPFCFFKRDLHLTSHITTTLPPQNWQVARNS